ncbi:hypothetical protein B0H21DRAFT_822676 [Amylocystis lapponica]|nr:hypothetical protein B0H21DRAFT_822676 [Amylocystis lapponica]
MSTSFEHSSSHRSHALFSIDPKCLQSSDSNKLNSNLISASVQFQQKTLELLSQYKSVIPVGQFDSLHLRFDEHPAIAHKPLAGTRNPSNANLTYKNPQAMFLYRERA